MLFLLIASLFRLLPQRLAMGWWHYLAAGGNMNFYARTATGIKAGVLPSAKLVDGWRGSEILWVKTALNWKMAWRRRIVYTNLMDLADANIFTLMGSPTKPQEYVFINKAVLRGVSAAALRTGVFPAGSTLLVINQGYIKGAGGAGGAAGVAGVAGSAGNVGWSNTTYATYGPWAGGAPGAAIISGGNALTFVAGNSSDSVRGGS